jgi:hypothetical protein
MAQNKVFISYSHEERSYLEALLPVLQAVPGIGEDLWFDEQGIDIGDEFHTNIQQALAEAGVGILLLSNHFLTSSYVKQHELPNLLQKAEQKTLKLGCLYVTTIPDAALEIRMVVDGQPRTVNLKTYQWAHSSTEPLESLDRAQQNAIYTRLTNWVVAQRTARTETPLRRVGPRFELAIALRARRDHWEHRFSLPHAADFVRPALHCLTPEMVFRDASATINGDDLFQLLFGSDTQQSSAILGAAFDAGPAADPTRDSLRVRLLTDEERLYTLPWARISYQGRALVTDGWTVEFHADSTPGFPEYPPHTCYFPGKVVLIGTRDSAHTPQSAAHFHDLQHFFQRRWQQAPEPVLVDTATTLRTALSTGSPRLVYYYGPASREGLLLASAGEPDYCFPWSELAALLQRSRSVSAVFLNLLGEAGFDAMPQGRVLLVGTRAVLVQCHERTAAPIAAKAALDWLHSVFAASERLDPVVALYRHQHGQVAAWTHYSNWQAVVPQRLETVELVHLLLDRRSQRAELAHARDEFYNLKTRRIYHAVALGVAGCRVTEFPEMVSQHLRYNKRGQEVFIHRSVPLTVTLDSAQRLDDLMRQTFRVDPRQSVLRALLQQDTRSGNDFWFLVLGWVLPQPLADAAAGASLLQAIADWCRTHLLREMPAGQQDTNSRVLSVVAMEAVSLEVTEALEERLATLRDSLDDEDGFHCGALDRLAGVRLQDLRNYFQDQQICSCDDRYRREFPRLLLGARQEMPFDEAVTTIRRGEPDNWGNLFEELQALTTSDDWPPAPEARRFWESRDGR